MKSIASNRSGSAYRVKARLSALAALLVTALALLYALWDVDFQKLGGLLVDARYVSVAPFLALLVFFFWIKALRWSAILQPLGRFTWRDATPSMMIGFAANNLLPAHLGELLRAIVFSQRFRQPFSGVLASLLAERILDIVAILLLYFVAAQIIVEAPPELRVSAWIVAGLTAIACACIFLALKWPELLSLCWDSISRRLPDIIRQRGRVILQNVIVGLASLQSARQILLLLAYSVLQWLIMGIEIWLCLWAFETVVGVPAALVVLAVTTLAVTIPSAPGYIGAIQAAFVFALTPLGISNEVAFAASVLFLVVQWIPVTVVGMIFFMTSGIAFSELRREADQVRSLS